MRCWGSLTSNAKKALRLFARIACRRCQWWTKERIRLRFAAEQIKLSRSYSTMSQASGKRSPSKKPQVSRQQLTDGEDSDSLKEESKENLEENSSSSKNVPAIKKVDVLTENARKMVFSHAVVRFDCSNILLIREIIFVKESLGGKGTKHIMPRHRQDFDKKKLYYVKTWCDEHCQVQHFHDPYELAWILSVESKFRAFVFFFLFFILS